MREIKIIMSEEITYRDAIVGQDEPEAIWGRGDVVLYMRAQIGIKDTNDSNGNPIIADELYCVSKGGVTLPVKELP
jgi:hypothetical protein